MGQVLTEPPGDGTGLAPIPSLRYVLLVGDVLTRLDVDRLRRLAPGVTCVNLYGSTETQRAVGYHVVDAGAGPAAQRARQVLPLGRGMGDVQILVVNTTVKNAERLAGIGEVGEIWMRSPHLARGYLGDEALTRERFRVNPFTGDERDPVYRTGDLGRYLPDGEAVFAGRADQQVKIRGFRIEPGEIQATIGRLEGVRESVVVVREERGERYLAAYVVPEPGAAPDLAGRLRPFLAARLPDYMVPAAFVELPALPLTPNGKVDRRALPAPRRQAAGLAAPRGPVEERLAGVWADLLRLDRVGAHDNFFELGGHSLLATQLVSRVRGAFAVELPLRVIFEAPTVAGLAAWIERALRTSGGPAAAAIIRAPRDRPLPLSFAQERLWFLQLLEPASPAYNMMGAVRLAGRLDAGTLAAALSEILRRHEALRTTFRPTATGAVQEIQSWAPLPQPRVDLSALPAEVRSSEARRIAGEAGTRPFDLDRGPLLRALLLRLADEDHVALWSTHHIAADGWSLSAVFVPELTRLYTAFVEGRPSPLPELPVQYADYAVWQREWLRGEALAEQLGYWRRQLAGLAPLELPADRPRPPAPSGRGGSRSWELPAGSTDALSRLARAGDATLFMALFAAFAAMLHRETGAVEVPVGMPVANRSRSEIEGLIGFFVNTLVLRGDLAGDPDLPALLARSRDTVLGALSHQDIPFERLVDELALPRNPHRPPLLRVTFQFQTASAAGGLDLPGLTLTPFEAGIEVAKFDLVLDLFEAAGSVAGALRYDSDLFDDSTIARLSGHFTTLLAAWIDEPGTRLSDLPLLTTAERHQLLVEWNPGPALPDRGRRCLHHLFEAQVDRAPEALALSALTYGELDRRANRLARHLQASGVRPGDRIALLLERSAEMIVAILAVLKTGAAYVPLDPAYPAERLAFTLEDSGASLLVTEGDRTLAAVRAIRLDAERDGIERRSGERLEMPLDPDLPAYVIYTSGSTGRPKGVVVSHTGVDRLFTATEPWFGFGAEDVWTLFHSYAFDFSVWELWGALLHGGRLVVVPYWESRSPEDFYCLLRDERVTVLNQTPSAFRQLLWAEEAVLHGDAPDLALRWVIFGGEALEPASLAPWFARHGDERPRLVNMYGITETTVHVTYRPVRAADLAKGSLIGEPIPDLAVHLLDASLQPVPIGTPGEIHVGGAGLAQGYLGRPDLTAGRFIPDPFSRRAGARLYRSGDLARRFPDGDLEYLGRIDQQVKIRGFRIELGEIEAALAAQAGVREAVVLAREGHLVAYLSGEAADPAVLRQALAERLPDYMLPAAFVFLDALPLTENGKIDRRALPAPEAAGAAIASRVPARDPLERFLAGQFRDVLGLPAEREIGIDEDFFELGGTSISSAIFTHRLQEALGEIVHIVTIFDHPTVSSLADHVRERHAEAARRLATGGEAAAVALERGVLVPIQAGSPGRRPFFLVHSVGGEVMAYFKLARLLGPDQPVYGLQSPDPPLEDVREMAALYAAALREVQPRGPYRIAGWSMGGIVAFELARQLEAQGETTEVLAVIDATAPGRWDEEPEFRSADWMALFATALEQIYEVEIPPEIELPDVDLATLDLDAALGIALDLGRKVGLLSPTLEPAELRRLFERFRANRSSLRTYRGPYSYGGEIHLFRATDGMTALAEDPTLGWGELLNGRVRIFDVPGDHRTIVKRGAATLAAHLRALLRERD
jgi:amino acid adenylation domain-containing protein